MNFKERLRECRVSKRIKTKEIAMHLQVTERTYYYYEQGSREPSLEVLYKICKFLDVSADYLLGLTDYF